MKVRLLSLVIIFTFHIVHGQEQVDTIISTVSNWKSKDYELKAYNYFDSLINDRSNNDSASSSLYKKLLAASEKDNNHLVSALAYKNLATLASSEGEKARAIALLKQAEEIAKAHHLDIILGNVLMDMAGIYGSLDKKGEALKSELDSYPYILAYDSTKAAFCQFQLANTQYQFHNYEIAIDNALTAIKLYESVTNLTITDSLNYMNAVNTIGVCHRELFNYDSAVYYLKKAHDLSLVLKNEFWEGLSNGNLGVIYLRMGIYDKALPRLKNDFRISRKYTEWRSAVTAALNIGEIYRLQKDFVTAKNYYDSANMLIDKHIQTNLVHVKMKYYQYISIWYADKGDFENAYRYHVRYSEQMNHQNTENTKMKLAEIKAIKDFDNQLAEIELLTKSSELQKKEIEKRNLIISGSIILISIVIGMTLFIYNQFRLKKKDNKLLEKQKKKIEAQNEELESQSEQLHAQNKVIQDINDNLEKEVEKRTAKLKKLNYELDTFLYRASHDIRQPIATILGLENLGRNYTDNDDLIEILTRIKSTAKSMDNMLWKLQMSYLLHHQVESKEIIEITSFTENIISKYEEFILRHDIKIEIDSPQLDFTTYSDIFRIILRNIIENAIYFCNEDSPYIKIKAEKRDREYVISISDNGDGISEECLPRIYHAFFKGNTRSKGNGLGLYLAAKAAEILNINILVESEAHKGSEFTLHIPFN